MQKPATMQNYEVFDQKSCIYILLFYLSLIWIASFISLLVAFDILVLFDESDDPGSV